MVYLAPPSSFEDENDLRSFKRYDMLSDQQLYDQYFSISKNENRHFSVEEHSKYAMEWTQKTPIKNPEYLAQSKVVQFDNFDKRIGVLSLTAYNDEVPMWNKYANDGKGICVGFDSSALFKIIKGRGPVNYPPEGLPDILVGDSYEEQIRKRIFSKEPKWQFEKEYRAYGFSWDPLSLRQRQLILPANCYRQIILGWAITDKDRRDIASICAVQLPLVVVRQAVINGQKVEIHNL